MYIKSNYKREDHMKQKLNQNKSWIEMAPSRRRTRTTSASALANDPTRRIMTRSIYKKQQQQQQKLKIQSLQEEEEISSTTEASTNSVSLLSGDNKEVCSTPKGDKYKIPKISTCPPAPKKKRLVLNCLPGSALPSSSAKFFSHSDLEVFFLFAPRNIHA